MPSSLTFDVRCADSVREGEGDHPKPTDGQLLLSINGRFNFSVLLPDLRFHRCAAGQQSWTLIMTRADDRS